MLRVLVGQLSGYDPSRRLDSASVLLQMTVIAGSSSAVSYALTRRLRRERPERCHDVTVPAEPSAATTSRNLPVRAQAEYSRDSGLSALEVDTTASASELNRDLSVTSVMPNLPFVVSLFVVLIDVVSHVLRMAVFFSVYHLSQFAAVLIPVLAWSAMFLFIYSCLKDGSPRSAIVAAIGSLLTFVTPWCLLCAFQHIKMPSRWVFISFIALDCLGLSLLFGIFPFVGFYFVQACRRDVYDICPNDSLLPAACFPTGMVVLVAAVCVASSVRTTTDGCVLLVTKYPAKAVMTIDDTAILPLFTSFVLEIT